MRIIINYPSYSSKLSYYKSNYIFEYFYNQFTVPEVCQCSSEKIRTCIFMFFLVKAQTHTD